MLTITFHSLVEGLPLGDLFHTLLSLSMLPATKRGSVQTEIAAVSSCSQPVLMHWHRLRGLHIGLNAANKRITERLASASDKSAMNTSLPSLGKRSVNASGRHAKDSPNQLAMQAP